MSERLRVFDVCVVGGGPSGAVAAALLASWGYTVLMVHREPRQQGLAESLPGSTRKLFAFLDLLETIEAQRFQPNTGNVSEWAGVQSATRSDVPGYHIERVPFDAALRGYAIRRGVTALDAAVRDVILGDPHQILSQMMDGSRVLHRARYVLDCSGRAAVAGRRLFERRTAGYRTVAFMAEWTTSGWPDSEETKTIIESYSDGWAWSVPVVGNRRTCTVMIDPRSTDVRGAGLGQQYLTELRKARSLFARLSSSRQISRTWACDATVYQCATTGDAGILLVGDAASFVEPLSSAGVRKAITSAWRAAVIVNTTLHDAGMASIGRTYYDERERQMFSECLERSRSFFSTAAAHHDTDFWQRRALAATGAERSPSREAVDATAAQAAFQRLRDGAGVPQFVAGDALCFAATPEVDGAILTMQEGVIFPGGSAPTLFAAGVRLAPLLRIALGSRGIDTVLQQYETQCGAAPPDQILSALALLVAGGLLVPSFGMAQRPHELTPAS